jgi:hypothetical protein
MRFVAVGSLENQATREMLVSQWTQLLNGLRSYLTEVGVIAAQGPRHAARWPGPRAQPNKASSRDERLPDLRAIVAATTLQSRAISSLLASSARLSAME